MKGKVKWFDRKKGYGFVTGEDGKDYFAHYSSIKGDGYRNLAETQDVEFVVGEGKKGPQATEIVPGPAPARQFSSNRPFKKKERHDS